jgi:adenosylcobinamide-phosphate synthase
VGEEVDLAILRPHAVVLAGAVVFDAVAGDPQYRGHPIRMMGFTVTWFECGLRAMGCNGYGGGIALVALVCAGWCIVTVSVLLAVDGWIHGLALLAHGYLLYSLLALRSLVDHGWAVERAARSSDLRGARYATSRFVARDTQHMGFEECRRAAIESISENLTDGYVSPLFWYTLGGLPGILVFKACSTLDSMVGNKSDRYIRFGWASARTDDVLNWIPARTCWLLIALAAIFVPSCSPHKAFGVGWRQHAVVPGPNSGWSEAATAGAIQRRLVGPIRLAGCLVTDIWLGDPEDPPAGESRTDMARAIVLACVAGVLAVAACLVGIWYF